MSSIQIYRWKYAHRIFFTLNLFVQHQSENKNYYFDRYYTCSIKSFPNKIHLKKKLVLDC